MYEATVLQNGGHAWFVCFSKKSLKGPTPLLIWNKPII